MVIRRQFELFLVTVSLTLFLGLIHHTWKPVDPSDRVAVARSAFPSILNSTLGFQRIYAINLPSRTDRRDILTLAAAFTGIDITWVDGVKGEDVSEKALPGKEGAKVLPIGNIGSWRAHMNVLQRIVQENVTTALIFEDDVDWDIRLKSQLQLFALAATAFTTPSSPGPHTMASFHRLTHDNLSVPITQLPPAPNPHANPYGPPSDWDVLWLGHCGTSLPKGPSPNPKVPPHLRITIPHDETVPPPKHMRPHPFARQDPWTGEYPPHTRLVHAAHNMTCTQAYAVSQRGARRLLWRFGVVEGLGRGLGWDLVLGEWCDGVEPDDHKLDSGNEGEKKNKEEREEQVYELKGRERVCVTASPPLFGHVYGGESDIMAAGGGLLRGKKEVVPYVRWSVRLNLGRLVEGGEVKDQWGEEEEGSKDDKRGREERE